MNWRRFLFVHQFFDGEDTSYTRETRVPRNSPTIHPTLNPIPFWCFQKTWTPIRYHGFYWLPLYRLIIFFCNNWKQVSRKHTRGAIRLPLVNCQSKGMCKRRVNCWHEESPWCWAGELSSSPPLSMCIVGSSLRYRFDVFVHHRLGLLQDYSSRCCHRLDGLLEDTHRAGGRVVLELTAASRRALSVEQRYLVCLAFWPQLWYRFQC